MPERSRLQRFPVRFLDRVRETMLRGVLTQASAAELLGVSLDEVLSFLTEPPVPPQTRSREMEELEQALS